MKYKYGKMLILSLSPHGRLSLSPALGSYEPTGPVMDIHNMIYNTSPWMP